MYNLNRLNKYGLRVRVTGTGYYVRRPHFVFIFFEYLLLTPAFSIHIRASVKTIKKNELKLWSVETCFFMLKFIFNYLLFIPYTFFIIAHCAFNLNKNFFDATLSAAVKRV